MLSNSSHRYAFWKCRNHLAIISVPFEFQSRNIKCLKYQFWIFSKSEQLGDSLFIRKNKKQRNYRHEKQEQYPQRPHQPKTMNFYDTGLDNEIVKLLFFFAPRDKRKSCWKIYVANGKPPRIRTYARFVAFWSFHYCKNLCFHAERLKRRISEKLFILNLGTWLPNWSIWLMVGSSPFYPRVHIQLIKLITLQMIRDSTTIHWQQPL